MMLDEPGLPIVVFVGYVSVTLLSWWLLFVCVPYIRRKDPVSSLSLRHQEDVARSQNDDNELLTTRSISGRSAEKPPANAERHSSINLKILPKNCRAWREIQTEERSGSTASATQWSSSTAREAPLSSTNPTSVYSITNSSGSRGSEASVRFDEVGDGGENETVVDVPKSNMSRVQTSRGKKESSMYTQQWLDGQDNYETLKAQIKQKDEEINKLQEDLIEFQQQDADHVGSIATLNWSLAQKDREVIDDAGPHEHQKRLKDTVCAYENNLKNLERSYGDELKRCRKACSDSHKQLETQITKVMDQDVENRALQATLSETEINLQASQDAVSGLHNQLEEEKRKAESLATQLQGTEVTVEEYHNRLGPLIDRNAEMKAEITADIITIKERDGEILEMTRLWEIDQHQNTELQAHVGVMGKLRDEAVTRCESWRMKYEDLKNGQDRAVIYSDVEGDLAMIDAPGLGFKVDIPWVMQVGQENIKLRLEIEELTARLHKSELGATEAGSNANAKADQYRLQSEATASKLQLVKKEHDDVVREHQSVMQDIRLDPLNLYHPVYKKIDDLRARVKEREANVARLEEQLLEARAMSWDRRTSMVECHSPKW